MDIRTVDVAAASAHGVLVTHATPGFVSAVNEWILGVMIDLARGISKASAVYQRGLEPQARMGIQLSGATLGVVGLGAIGSRLVVLATQLGMKVIAYDPFVSEVPDGAETADLQSLLTCADFVVCLAVANETTENSVRRGCLSPMKPTAHHQCVARQPSVDELALLAALEAGSIARPPWMSGARPIRSHRWRWPACPT
ncbi:MAG: NAD(P)-dependent oxidoreductase [Burkholderiaceae bacterium]